MIYEIFVGDQGRHPACGGQSPRRWPRVRCCRRGMTSLEETAGRG